MNTTGYAQSQQGLQNAYNGANQAQGLAGAVIPVLEAQVNRLSSSAQDIETLAFRLHALADRLFGPVPANPAGKDSPPSPSHSIGKLNDAHEWMDRARLNLSAAVARIESL